VAVTAPSATTVFVVLPDLHCLAGIQLHPFDPVCVVPQGR